MLKQNAVIREAADAIAQEAASVIDSYIAGRVTDEPHITDRLLGAIESRMRSLSGSRHSTMSKGFMWSAMTLRSGSGSAAHEKKYGADLMGVFTASLPEFSVSKGFLAQAKRIEPGVEMSVSDWKRLLDQCERMLNVTSDSFVVGYSKSKGVRFFSALSVLGMQGKRDVFRLHQMPPRSFFERHFECFIGDRNLNKPEISVLTNLQKTIPDDERPAARVLQLKLTKVG